jgi:hypothetical protein
MDLSQLLCDWFDKNWHASMQIGYSFACKRHQHDKTYTIAMPR